MRIGLLTADLTHHHGWGHHNLSLARALARCGVEVRVIAARNSPTDFDFPVLPLLPNVVPADQHQLFRMMQATPRIRRTFRDCDLVHALAEPYAPLAMVSGKPYFITGHGSYAQAGINRHPGVRALHKAAFRRAHTVVCVSRYTAQVAAEYTPGIHTAVVSNGIDPARFASLPPPAETRGPTVLSVGGVKARKGTLPLVQAIALVRQKIPDVQCVVIGTADAEPAYTQRVRDEIQRLHLSEHVHLLGKVPEHTLLSWYAAADVFALPSTHDGWKFEGYGIVHLEASAAGLPVIGTDQCGAVDAIEQDVTGLVVPLNALETALPDAILDLLNDPVKRGRMGEAGRERAAAFTWDRAAEATRQLYEAALA